MILLLEDDADRVRRFTAAIRAIDPDIAFRLWSSARAMLREMDEYLPGARLISLDHDLVPVDGADDCGGEDPGDGLEVAKALAGRPPVCPVIIHSSNGERSVWMSGEFELGGWTCHRVPPIGDDWIEQDWRLVATKLLRRKRRKLPRPK
ncbi:MAG TPA: cyclic-phosphate processing receiver domain-containing protein [Gemmataceae bacterium]